MGDPNSHAQCIYVYVIKMTLPFTTHKESVNSSWHKLNKASDTRSNNFTRSYKDSG